MGSGGRGPLRVAQGAARSPTHGREVRLQMVQSCGGGRFGVDARRGVPGVVEWGRG